MMVKGQKFSRVHSSGFRAVDNMSDSEGFGSSGRVETEMVASEGSCAPKRKCISLNDDNSEYFGVPLQVISVAKLRQWEKKNLKIRLRAELDQVRIFREKVALQFRNGVTLSSSSVIHSSSNVQKVLTIQSLQKSSKVLSGKAKKSESLSGKGKKRAPAGQGEGPPFKRGMSGRFESASAKQAAGSSTSHVMLMNQCESLLQRLMLHQYGAVFNTPVDVVKFKIPDYFTVIKHPMDLGTVKKKIASGVYLGPLEFLADVRLTFSNAMTYNPPGNSVHNMAATLSKYFELRWKSIEKKLSLPDSKSVPKRSGAPKEVEAVKEMPPVKKRRVIIEEHKVKPNVVKQMTNGEKDNLSRDLESLLADLPAHIIDFLRKRTSNANQVGEDEIEVDIDDLNDDELFTLRRLVDDHLQEIKMNTGKEKPCEMEIPNNSRLGNSSMQLHKGQNPIDEDVDIGGNDAPVLSYPPVEIEKDNVLRNSKCNSSSSSSSDSGSSFSGSDSGCSSGSQSDDAKASSPANRTKETLSSAEIFVPETNDPVDPCDGNQAVSCLDQFEQTSQPRPVSVEADSRQEEESAPSERQVSPGKLYRAALLRGRFADTILKARAKTLNPGEKGDPEKLRREREELERHQREERARLQAEAKAAEAARKQAEAEAAAEAKRMRQLEREAARQALLKMEKTVEINENCPLLEDLEMLRVGPPELVPSSVDECSPAHSEGGLGSFRFRGSSNPLEQLGLYMKADEEEEEGEHEDILDAVNDVEEGENDVEEGEIN